MAHSHEHNHCDSCSHEHEHEHHHEHSLKKQLWLIIATVVLLIIAVLIEHNSQLSTLNSQLTKWQLLLVYLVPYLLIGHETLHEAWEGITKGDAFNEHFLMSVATTGALCIGFLPGAETEFPEAVFVMLFFQVGELFEGYAEGKSRDSIAHLMDIRPDVAHVERNQESGDRSLEDIGPEAVGVGETIVIRPGDSAASAAGVSSIVCVKLPWLIKLPILRLSMLIDIMESGRKDVLRRTLTHILDRICCILKVTSVWLIPAMLWPVRSSIQSMSATWPNLAGGAGTPLSIVLLPRNVTPLKLMA